EFRHGVSFDAVTGLPETRALHERLDRVIAQAQRRGQSFGVLAIDLAGFHPINDEFGPRAGDYVLRDSATRITQTIRSTDIVARVGVDEYVLVFPDAATAEAAEEIAVAIAAVLSAPIPFGGQTLQVGAYIGIARYPEAGTTTDALLSGAETALSR